MQIKCNAVLIAKLKDKTKNFSSSHCVFHRHALALRKITSELMIMLNDSIKILNYIKSQSFKIELFKIMCADIRFHYQSSLLHTKVRWLSPVRACTGLMELRVGITVFLMGHNPQLAKILNDEDWV